jgi:DNA repair photolyase
MPVLHEITCKSLLNKSGIPGVDYAVNPYTGCGHACAYCYARFMARHTRHGMAWGAFCDVKTNAVEVLERELRRRSKGLVMLSSVTDAYQAVEADRRLTRGILGLLADAAFPVSILTKSDLVVRDLDLLRRFPNESLEVGFSINTADDAVARAFEPGAPAPSRRLAALKNLHQERIRTWVFVAPVLPGITERTLDPLMEAMQGCADHVLVDGLNYKCGNTGPIEAALGRLERERVAEWKAALGRGSNDDPVRRVERRIAGAGFKTEAV